MHLRITGDTNAESRVGEFIDESSGPTRQFFAPKDYGKGVVAIAVILMCRNPELNFKRRIRFDRKDKNLYIDVMLDLMQMIQATPELRRKIIAERLMEEIPAVVHKYSIRDFDEARFTEDLKAWLTRYTS